MILIAILKYNNIIQPPWITKPSETRNIYFFCEEYFNMIYFFNPCWKNLTEAFKNDKMFIGVSPLCMIRWREIVDQRWTFGEFISQCEERELADSSYVSDGH